MQNIFHVEKLKKKSTTNGSNGSGKDGALRSSTIDLSKGSGRSSGRDNGRSRLGSSGSSRRRSSSRRSSSRGGRRTGNSRGDEKSNAISGLVSGDSTSVDRVVRRLGNSSDGIAAVNGKVSVVREREDLAGSGGSDQSLVRVKTKVKVSALNGEGAVTDIDSSKIVVRAGDSGTENNLVVRVQGGRGVLDGGAGADGNETKLGAGGDGGLNEGNNGGKSDSRELHFDSY